MISISVLRVFWNYLVPLFSFFVYFSLLECKFYANRTLAHRRVPNTWVGSYSFVGWMNEWMNEWPNQWWIFLFLMDFLINVLVRRSSFPSGTWQMKHVNGKNYCRWDYLNNLRNKISKSMLLLENRTTRLWITIVKQNYSLLLLTDIYHHFIFLLTPRELLHPRTTSLF